MTPNTLSLCASTVDDSVIALANIDALRAWMMVTCAALESATLLLLLLL